MDEPKKKFSWMRKIKENPNDMKFTPIELAKELIGFTPLENGDTVLDPFCGDGSFYEQYPDYVHKDWCEITDGVDFFEYHTQVNWIVSNPPYSKLTQVFEHSVLIATKGIAFLIGVINLSPNRLAFLEENGFYITHMRFVQVRGWFGLSVYIIAEKNKPSMISYDTTKWEMPKIERDIHYAKEKTRMAAYYLKRKNN